MKYSRIYTKSDITYVIYIFSKQKFLTTPFTDSSISLLLLICYYLYFKSSEILSTNLYSWDKKKVPRIGQPFGLRNFPLKTFLYKSKLFKLTAPSNVSIIICGVWNKKEILMLNAVMIYLIWNANASVCHVFLKRNIFENNYISSSTTYGCYRILILLVY